MKNNIKKQLKKARHPAEIPLMIVAALITIAFYVFLAYLCVRAATNEDALNKLMEFLGTDNSTVKFIVKFGAWGVIIIIIYLALYLTYLDKVYIGKSSVSSVRLKDSKYKDINDTIVEYCKKLGIKRIPLAYIEYSPVDSSFLGVKVRGDDAVSVSSNKIVQAEQKNDFAYIRYLLARRMAHIYLGHNNLFLTVFTFVAKLIPIFSNAYERAMCYSTDKVVEALIGEDETIKGIYSTYYDDALYEENADINMIIQDKIKTENNSEVIGRFIENLFSDDPLPNYRLEAIYKEGKTGRLF